MKVMKKWETEHTQGCDALSVGGVSVTLNVSDVFFKEGAVFPQEGAESG